MTDELRAARPVSRPAAPTDLTDRPAAYSVIAELFRVQETMAQRSLFRRIFGFRPVHPDAQSWFSGAIGERAVGKLLAQLGPEWTVLHAVPVGSGDSDIDHVVIGPPGVFTINTKRHRGKKIWVVERILMVAGQKTDHLRNSRHEAKRAAALLAKAAGVAVDVHPIVAIVEPASFTFKQRPADVSIMDARALPRWLKRRRAVLAPVELSRIIDAASEARTWHPTAELSIDPTAIDRFIELEREDNHARIVRVVWASAAVIAVALVAYNFVLPAISAAMIAGVGAL
ncbi:nuclease-related domain-containing protein [Salinibacterium sp. SWN1162]|uniref:nuclease-related domain-containing protein n=1 Tax=Salinibacterium sp. SWN1162 TaxID=2792053 RepID=UPI0018CFE44D|nr:nuclease-related domain-containing protein [Salinibacterium sp. SWN1162]MBH0008594.1 NERD domain-containing protein [Salinibacterium sp. SWN1162]